MKSWKQLSKKLEEEINRSAELVELVEALLSENGEDTTNLEKTHWWNFLSEKISCIPVNELKQRAREIKENSDDQCQKEIRYCRLLGIKLPQAWKLVDKTLRRQLEEAKLRIPSEYVRKPAWSFRWIYAWRGDVENHGITLKELKRRLREGEALDKVYKLASFTTSVQDGTPEKTSSERKIEIDADQILMEGDDLPEWLKQKGYTWPPWVYYRQVRNYTEDMIDKMLDDQRNGNPKYEVRYELNPNYKHEFRYYFLRKRKSLNYTEKVNMRK